MKNYKGQLVFVTEFELKSLFGRFEFGGASVDANGFDRARNYVNRPLNECSDARVYAIPRTVVKGRMGQVGGRESMVFADVQREQTTFAAIDNAEQLIRAGSKAAMGIDKGGCLKVNAITDGQDRRYSRTWGRNPVMTLDFPGFNGLSDTLKALEGRSEAKYLAAGKAWEMAVFDRLQELKKSDPNIVEVFYVGSFENQRTHDLQQACDILVYTLVPLA